MDTEDAGGDRASAAAAATAVADHTGSEAAASSGSDSGASVGDRPQAHAKPSPTSYSFAASALRQRHVPLRESIFPSSSSAAQARAVYATATNQSNANAEASSPSTHSTGAGTSAAGGGAAGRAVPDAKPAAAPPTAQAPDDEAGLFECNICLDMASDPVVTLCGHLFCWPCIHRWMVARLPASNSCPVCKAGVDRDKVIPIYVRGRDHKDPRSTPASASPSRGGTGDADRNDSGQASNEDVPHRPPGQRPEPTPAPNTWNQFFMPGATGGGAFGNIHVGLGFLPFGFHFMLGTNGNMGFGDGGVDAANQNGNGDPQHMQRMQRQAQIQAFASKVFLMIATLIFVSIILY